MPALAGGRADAAQAMDRTLNGPRLLLRAPRPGDAEPAFDRWAQDPAVHRHLGWRPHHSLAQTHQQLDWDSARWLKRSAFTWMLLPAGEPAPVGMVQLLPQSQGGAPPHHLRLGYLLARPWQGKGLMREAVQRVLSHALAQPEVWRVDALVDVDNAASLRLLLALGLVQEGRLGRHSLHPNVSGQPRDVWLLAALRGAWPAASVQAVKSNSSGEDCR